MRSANLAVALTGSTWQDRILGRSEMVRLTQRATWLCTGNNIRLGGDMARRCYWIRLDAQTAHPWRRTGFRHPGLIGWVKQQRGPLLGALLTLARAWWAEGQPAGPVSPLGGFDDWSRVTGGILAHAGIPGFLGNLDALYQHVDEEGEQWENFLATWLEMIGRTPITVAELVARLKEPSAQGLRLTQALPDLLAGKMQDGRQEGSFVRVLGRALGKRADMIVNDDGLKLVQEVPPSAGRSKWRVVTRA